MLAVLDQKNLVVGSSELVLLYGSSTAEFFGGDLFESWDDSGSSSEGKELNLDTTNPSDGWEVVVHEQVVGLVVKSPLAEHDVGA